MFLIDVYVPECEFEFSDVIGTREELDNWIKMLSDDVAIGVYKVVNFYYVEFKDWDDKIMFVSDEVMK